MFTWKFSFTWVLGVVVLCLHSSAIVTSPRVRSDVNSAEGGVDLNPVIPIQMRQILLKITWLDCYDLNDRGRMEIDHFFASGAVDGRATTHEMGRPAERGAMGDPTRAWWRVQPRLLTQKRVQFLQHNPGTCHRLVLFIIHRNKVLSYLVLSYFNIS